MPKLLGNNYRLYIESATAGTYNEIRGQQTLRVSRQAAVIDTSTKDDGNYGTQAPGQRSLTIDCEFLPNLPDTNGYGRLETRANANPQVATNFQIRKAPYATGDSVFQASMWIGNFDTDYPRNEAVKCTCQLTLESAPTTDALS